MSHKAVQHAIVRMMYDPTFLEAVYADAGRALGADCTAEECRWLTSPDPRAYRTDRHRRTRTLAALVDEFPASRALVGLAMAERADATLDAFFSHQNFHTAIQGRRPLWAAFAEYVGSGRFAADEWRTQLAEVARLEHAVAALRRRSAPAPAVTKPDGNGAADPTPRLRTSERVDVLRLREGTLKQVAALRAGSELPALGMDEEWALLERDAAGAVTAEEASPQLAVLLDSLREPMTWDDAMAIARDNGAKEGEERAVLDDLIAQGVIVEGHA